MSRSRRLRRWACAAALATTALTTIPATHAEGRSLGTGFEANRARVDFRGAVTLRGGFRERYARPASTGGLRSGEASYGSRPARNAPVRILYRTAGAKRWKTVGHTRTGKAGRYQKRIRLRRTGYLRAQAPDGTMTAKRRIRVGSRVRPRVSRRHLGPGQRVRIAGRVNPGSAGRKVVVKVGSQRERTRTRSGGRFSVRMPIPSVGTRRIVIKARSDRAAAGDRARPGKVTAYRRAMASYYGPGLYGNRTACGGTLTPSTVGVAHKTLPCGTKLTFRYGRRTVRTRVIDRGPFHAGREFDLTEALKNKLGFGSTGYVQVNK